MVVVVWARGGGGCSGPGPGGAGAGAGAGGVALFTRPLLFGCAGVFVSGSGRVACVCLVIEVLAFFFLPCSALLCLAFSCLVCS